MDTSNSLDRKKIIERYWLNRLSGDLPVVRLPGFGPGTAENDSISPHQALPLSMQIPEPAVEKLNNIGNHSDVALFILCLSSLNLVLTRYTGVEDLVIGTISPQKPGVKDKLLFCRNRVPGDITFKQAINRVKQTVLEAFNYSDYSFGVLYQKLLAKSDSDRLELFNAALIYDKIQNKSKLLNQFDIVLVLSLRDNRLFLELNYKKDRYTGGMVQRLGENVVSVIGNLPGTLDQTVSGLDILSPAEKKQLADFNRQDRVFAAADTAYPTGKTLHHLFEKQVEKNPGCTALLGIDGSSHISYRELDEQANRLAGYLRGKGIGRGTLVGLMTQRSLEMVVAQLGIWKAGGAYVPIDPQAPTKRVTTLLEDCGTSFLITDKNSIKNHSYTQLQGLQSAALQPLVTAPRQRITHFDSLPLPDRSLVDMEKYNRLLGQAVVKNRILIQASRGCPHDCIYCYRIWPRKQVARSSENIFEEIQFYYNLGIRKFDIFMLNMREGKRLFRLIIDNKMKDIQLFFPNGFRGDLLNKEYIDLLVEAGTVNFALALETASPRLQKLINKHLDIERFRKNIEYTCETYPHILLELFTLHGIPTETREEAMMTLEFIKSLQWVHFPYVNVLKIYHNTGMERLALENGITREAIARSENMAWHELSDTLPFDREFSHSYQGTFLNEYVLSRQRLLAVLPHQMKILTRDELVKKYDSYLPADIKRFSHLLEFVGLEEEELGAREFHDPNEDIEVLTGFNQRLKAHSPSYGKHPEGNGSEGEALRVLLLDLSQFFDDGPDMLYDVVDPPLGLIYILTYLNERLGDQIKGKILKSRVDFESLEDLKVKVEEFKPAVIGIRSLSYYADFFHETAAALRQWGSDVPIIAGGPYATVDYKTILQDRNIDMVVLSEGELTFAEILEKMIDNSGKLPGEQELKKIPGIAFVPCPGVANTDGKFAREIIMSHHLNTTFSPTTALKPEPVKSPLDSYPDLAYIIFTSGSTGKPKGVMVESRGVVNVLHWFARTYQVGPGTHVIQLSSYTFDPSIEQIFSTLLYGGTVHLADKELIAHRERFIRFMQQHRVNIINFVPNTLKDLLADNTKLKLKHLRAVISGGEKLDESVKNRLLEKGYPLYNQYGPTETTIDALMDQCTTGGVTLGRPILNARCYILDPHTRPVPIGVLGELYIGGPGVARGYLNSPELTAEKFLSLSSGFNRSYMSYRSYIPERTYKTGDLVRWLPDGKVEFAGRIDFQVKIRGYRIELGEIESRLLEHPAVIEAVVTVIDLPGDTGGAGAMTSNDKCLAAYIVMDPEHSISELELKEFLDWQLPDYMIPGVFVELKEIPLTPNGKVDRGALAASGAARQDSTVEYAAPTNEVERVLAEVWQSVLGRDKISINDNFFTIGGDSIKSIQIASRMNMRGYKAEMKDLFKNPTIAKLAPLTRKLRDDVPTDQSMVTGVVPLTPIQADFFQNLPVEPHHFNQAVMLHFPGSIDENAIQTIFSRIQEHHDALRMSFREEKGKIIQTLHGLDYPFSPQCFDFSHLSDKQRVYEEMQMKVNEIQTGIHLEQGPLMKLGLFHLDDGDRLLIVIHHLVVDGVSWRILFEDIDTLYRQYQAGKPLELPLKSDSFKKWSEELSRYANSPAFLEESTRWSQLKSKAKEVLDIETDLDGENLLRDAGLLSFRLSEEETRLLLTKVNHAFGTEIDDILLTALALAISDTWGKGHERFLVALEGHGRQQEILKDVDISRTVGWFTSVYPAVLELAHRHHHDLARQIKEIKEILRQIPHKGIGYGILKYLTLPENKKEIQFSLNPRISFNYLGQFDRDVEERSFRVDTVSVGQTRSLNGNRDYELDVSGIIAYNQLSITVNYGGKRFKRETIETLSGHFKTRLCRIISFCSAREKPELTPADFTYKKLSLDAFDAINAGINGEIEDIYPLAPMQEGMLFHALYDPGSPAYFVQTSYRLHGELVPALVEKSINELFKRYDILRTLFIHEGLDRPLQVVLKEQKLDFIYKDIRREVPAEQKEVYIRELCEKDRQRLFKLSSGPLMRVSLTRVHDREYEFTWSHHHILMDGWCAGKLISEFFDLYQGLQENRPVKLSPLTPYRTYIQWLERQKKDELEKYWSSCLGGYEGGAGIPRAEIVTSLRKNYQNQTVSLTLEARHTKRLNQLAASSNVTLNTFIQVVWGIILAQYAGKQDVVFGAVVSGRPSRVEDVENMMGLFINTVPVRVRWQENTRFNQLLRIVQEHAIQSESYHYYPLAKIQTLTPLKQELLDHILVFENFPIADHIRGAVKHRENDSSTVPFKLSAVRGFEQTNYDLNVIVVPGPQLAINLNYNGHVYQRELLEKIGGYIKNLVLQILDAPGLPIKDLTLMSGQDIEEVLYEFNKTQCNYPREKTIHQLFAEQTARTPDHTAVSFEGTGGLAPLSVPGSITYRQLNEKSHQLAYLLQEKGVNPDTIVAIMMERSLEMIIGILAILKAGGAYLPIDPGYPQERIDFMLKDSGAEILLKDNDFTSEAFLNLSEGRNFTNDQCPMTNDQIAYIIYTSGTTGKPKGVMVTHRNVVRLMINDRFQFDFNSRDVWTLFHSINFDFSVWEMYGALIYGGKLVIIPQITARDTKNFLEILKTRAVTVLNQTPAAFYNLIEEELKCPGNRLNTRYVIFGGDALAPRRLKEWKEKYPAVKLVNMFGITETTVHVTYKEIGENEIRSGASNIGKPIPTLSVYILDSHLRCLPIGAAGECCVGGDGVGRGYLNNPELTAEKFLPLPPGFYRSYMSHRSYIPEKIYRSGDLVRRCPDGDIEFLGRIDTQVKIRGFRIELEEIEVRLHRHKDIKEAVVTIVGSDEPGKYLCAFIVSERDLASSAQKFKEYLSRHLPGYMIPSYFVQVEKIPVTPNGKIDRKTLASQGKTLGTGVQYAAPGNQMEKLIAGTWQEVLHLERVGIHDNFFDVGGNSLNIIQVNNKLKQALKKDIPLVTLFEYSTIHSFANYLNREKTGDSLTAKEIEQFDSRHDSGIGKITETLEILNGGSDE